MKLSKEEFKNLQREWYKRLEEQGFNDVEDVRNKWKVITESSIKTEIQSCDSVIEAKKQYFYLLNHFVNSEMTLFRNKIDLIVLTMRADGAKIKDIIAELHCHGLKRDRKSIRIIIRRYEMAWGIRTYSRKQLHLKD